MNRATQPAPARGAFSLLVLLVLVLAVTAQLVTGFLFAFHPGKALLTAHVAGGVTALAATIAEWAWLCATRAGRYRLKSFVAAGSGPAQWSEAAFLLVATATVTLGALLAAMMHGRLGLPFGAVLEAHRALAVAVAVLYVAHSLLSMRKSRSRRARPGGA